MSITVSEMRAEHIDGAVALQRACFPEPFPAELLWNHEHLSHHIRVFPEGQFVAADGELVVASASATQISEVTWESHSAWDETVGGPLLETLDRSGSTLYGLDISVHPSYRGRGIGRLLYQRRFELVKKLSIGRFGTACRLPGFQSYAQTIENPTIEQYVRAVVSEQVQDRTLSPLLRYGLTYLGVIHDYMEDEESGNAAALLEWKP